MKRSKKDLVIAPEVAAALRPTRQSIVRALQVEIESVVWSHRAPRETGPIGPNSGMDLCDIKLVRLLQAAINLTKAAPAAAFAKC